MLVHYSFMGSCWESHVCVAREYISWALKRDSTEMIHDDKRKPRCTTHNSSQVDERKKYSYIKLDGANRLNWLKALLHGYRPGFIPFIRYVPTFIAQCFSIFFFHSLRLYELPTFSLYSLSVFVPQPISPCRERCSLFPYYRGDIMDCFFNETAAL